MIVHFIHTDDKILSTCAKQVYVKLQNENLFINR